MRERVSRRAAQGMDASDAGPELLSWSTEHFEPCDEWPHTRHLVVHTDDPSWKRDLDERVYPLIAASSCTTMGSE